MSGARRYSIVVDPAAEREMKKIDRGIVKRIIEKVRELETNPRPPGAKALAGSGQGLTRIRVGDYRIIYQIRDREHLVLVVKVGHRGDVYR